MLLNDRSLVQEMLPCGFSDMGLPVNKTHKPFSELTSALKDL